jgi:Arc/MetJ-type ribon-helix-helix transcriptional regulator
MITTEKPINKAVATKLPPVELEEINKLVESGIFLSSADFVRQAIRDKLEAIKVIKIRDIDYNTAKKEILGYYQSYESSYMSDVANNLELDLELVAKITEELIKEGRIKDIS